MMPSENRVLIAIELSVSSWFVAVRLPGSEKSRLHRVEGGDTTALLALIRDLRSRAEAKLRQAREVLYRSFANRRQLASYVGIAPMPYQSGGMDRDRSISRAGNPRARTTLIQLAWLWLRYQPGSALSDWFRGRVGTLQGRTRRIAIVAMARKLLIALWRYVEIGVLPDGVELRAMEEATA
jgi:transposase